MAELKVLLEEIAKKQNLDKTDMAFIEWFANLSKQERENVMPVLLTSTLNSLSKLLKK